MSESQANNREPSIADDADILRCGYNMGYFDKPDIERWADSQIAAIDTPADDLLNLSMIRETHPVDVLNSLKSLSAHTPPEQSVATQIGFIGLCYCEGKITLEAAVRALFGVREEIGVSSEQKSAIYWLDDAYDLALAGYYGTRDEVEVELRRFVSPYMQGFSNFNKCLFSPQFRPPDS
jgi:hypothetical protein